MFMRRCLQLARNGVTAAPPNPLVGAVVVHRGKIIGEGFHRRYGEAHAEVNAIAAVKDKSLLAESTIYVNLEPCSHFGKTPPCCDLLIRHRLRRVVVGMTDPFAEVRGRGIKRMREAGIDVLVGVCESECVALNRAFITFHQRKRPFVTLKWAQSADGFMDYERADGTPAQLSTAHTTMHVHEMRARHDAILVGRRTAELDNPRLNVRHWVGTSPLRIVLAPSETLSSHLHLLTDGSPTLVYGSPVEGASAATVFAPPCKSVAALLDDLYCRGIQRLMVEGGSRVLQSFFESSLWDEAGVEHASVCLGHGVKAPQVPVSAVARTEFLWGVPFTFYTNPASV